MALKENKKSGVDFEPANPVAREPGFYVGDNGPYPTAEDAQAFIDGHLDGEGKVTEVTA